MKNEEALVINNPFKQLSKQKYPPVATAKSLAVRAAFKLVNFSIAL